ncbi:MAG: DUF2269 domain-containing protein [Erythrobacter sp.]
MDIYFLVKTLHIVSATVLFGTGIGIAFFFLMGMRAGFSRGDAAAAWFAARTTAVADMIFTLNAGIVQPISGFWLIHLTGYDLTAPWLVMTYILYVIALACWLPVVWLQLRIRDAWRAKMDGAAIDEVLLKRRFHTWFALGWPAFAALIAVFWLMVAKPV